MWKTNRHRNKYQNYRTFLIPGTAKMYSFIRRDLEIPFYCGQHSIDIWLQQILDSIEGRRIESVLRDIFSDGKTLDGGDEAESVKGAWEICWLTEWFTDWLTEWITNWVTEGMSDWVTKWLSDWVTEWRSDWLMINWLTDWQRNLTNRLPKSRYVELFYYNCVCLPLPSSTAASNKLMPWRIYKFVQKVFTSYLLDRNYRIYFLVLALWNELHHCFTTRS